MDRTASFCAELYLQRFGICNNDGLTDLDTYLVNVIQLIKGPVTSIKYYLIYKISFKLKSTVTLRKQKADISLIEQHF